MNGWGWAVAGYLVTALVWGGFVFWTRPGGSR